MSKQVFVLGAGFTKAFFRGAPLMTDDYAGACLEGKYDKCNFPTAHMLIRNERSRNTCGNINIERLMTRLDSKMPYDQTKQSSHELDLLLADLKGFLLTRLRNVKTSPLLDTELSALQNFARYCVENGITCITFNYDDAFDEVLWRVKRVHHIDDDTDSRYWHPDGGYGFFCRPSPLLVQEVGTVVMDKTSMYLLKLHGSMNWRMKLGCPQPVMADWLVHHEYWRSEEITLGERPDQQQIETYPDEPLDSRQAKLYLEPEPFIIPPVLTKSGLGEQPILRLIWSLAQQELEEADRVTFIGYSLPVTDIAAGTLFRESVRTKDIKIVNLASDPEERDLLRQSYRVVFEDLKDDQFYWDDARVWAATRQYEK